MPEKYLCITNSEMNDTEMIMNGKLNVPNSSNGSSKQLVVCLRRVHNTEPEVPLQVVLDRVVECPGCSQFLANEEKCAQHLLQECLLPKNSAESKATRNAFTKWLIRYFYAHNLKIIANEINELTNDKKASNGTVFHIVLREISFDLQCPVCEKYFYPSQACYEHVFENCLRTQNSENGVRIKEWFFQYFWSNSRSKLDQLSKDIQIQNFSKRVVCNYCKKEFLDSERMMKHFRLEHRKEPEAGDPICHFCNFKPGARSLLFRHMLEKHVKCGCGEKARDFQTLKLHLSFCARKSSCLCPICQEVEIESYTTEASFENHLLNCRRPVPLKLSIHDLYVQCDICWEQILKCNLDVHVAKHIKFDSDSVKRQKRNTFVNFSDLKDILSEQEFFRMKKMFSI